MPKTTVEVEVMVPVATWIMATIEVDDITNKAAVFEAIKAQAQLDDPESIDIAFNVYGEADNYDHIRKGIAEGQLLTDKSEIIDTEPEEETAEAVKA